MFTLKDKSKNRRPYHRVTLNTIFQTFKAYLLTSRDPKKLAFDSIERTATIIISLLYTSYVRTGYIERNRLLLRSGTSALGNLVFTYGQKNAGNENTRTSVKTVVGYRPGRQTPCRTTKDPGAVGPRGFAGGRVRTTSERSRRGTGAQRASAERYARTTATLT